MSRPDFCGTGMIRAGALNKGQGDEERKDAGVYDADPLSSCFPTNVRSHGVAMMDPYPSHIESKSNAGESYSNSNKKVSLRDSSVMAVRLKFQAPQRPAISPASPSVTFAERAEGHSRRLSVSEALLQDLKATRRQIDALNRMAYSFDANCDSADSEIQQLNKKIWTAESRYRPHIRRVEDSSNIIGHQSVNDWASQDSTFINEAVLPFKGSPVNFRPTQAASHFTPVTSTPTAVHLAPKKSPCPPNLMSYYSHLIPHRDIQTIPPSPGSSTKANKRRAYLARLLDD